MSDAARKAEQKLKLEKYKEELAARKAAKSPRGTPDTSIVSDDAPEETEEQRSRRLDAEAAAAVAERLKATEREAPKDLGSVNSLLAGLLAGGDDDDADANADDDGYEDGGGYGGESLSAPTGAGAGAPNDSWAATNSLLSMLSSSSVYDELAEEVESFDIAQYEAEMKESDTKLAGLLGRFEESSIYDDEGDTGAETTADTQLSEEALLATLPSATLEKLREAKRQQDLKMAELEAKIQQASRLVVMAKEKGVVANKDSQGNELKMMDVLNRLLAMVDDPDMVARLQQSQDFQKAKPQYHFDRFEKMTDEYRAKEASQDDAWARKKRAERLMELQAVREQVGDGGPQPSDNFFKRQDAAQRAAPKGRLAKTK